MFKKYFQNIFDKLKHGDAREESFYSSLESFVESVGESCGKRIEVISIPKKYEGQVPDFRVREKEEIIGHIEAKDFQKYPEAENLDAIEESGQLKKYKKAFPNLILTNFFEFRLYKNGILVDKVQIGRPFIAYKIKALPPIENQEKFESLLTKFFAFSIPETKKPKQLAIELADRTSFLKEKILEEIKKDNPDIVGFFQAFKKYLIATLVEDQFADLYAQTITYGLFAARTRATQKEFRRDTAVKFIPQTIPLLKKVFAFISSTELPESMEWIVDEISQVLAATDVSKIMHDFYKEGKGKDPIIHFYETFLAEYDPKEREKRGVYYTPEPVVSYIVRSIHKILKEKFNKEDGFATSSVTVLDPAAGTLTFPAEAIKLAKQEVQKKYGPSIWQSTVKDHILKDFYAFELLMAPYAIGHLKISLLLDELGYKMKKDDRFNLYLTNTLEMKKLAQSRLPLVSELSKESELAGKVKEEIPILVIMGNPPYSISSTNKSEFIEKEMDYYKEEVRDERNIQPLSDDYIKFIRFAHWKIQQAGQGVIGMITNNSYLDGLIHRGMRHKLMQDFDEIYILNLHGDLRRGAKTPDGKADENVFDIQSGVGIIILVKRDNLNELIRYSDLWGLREEKYKFLETHDVKNTKWQDFYPKGPNYFFMPRDIKGEKKYHNFISVKDIFEKYNAGVATGKDDVLVDFDKQSLIRRLSISDKKIFEIAMQNYGIKKELINKWYKELKGKDIEGQIRIYSYRPFDKRFVIYNPRILQRARRDIMDYFLFDNLGLIFRKSTAKKWYHVFITDDIMDGNYLEARTYIFPLHLYRRHSLRGTLSGQKRLTPIGQMELDEQKENQASNIKENIINELSITYKKKISPKKAFYYIYAILYSNIYRKRYNEFLKIDFPRVPFTKNRKIFEKISKLGEKLAILHLLKDPLLNKPVAKFYGNDNSLVKIRRYDEKRRRVYINEKQYFEPIKKEIWAYMIGGYQVLDKWLKDRKDKILSADDIKHYCRIVTVIKETIRIQREIDKIYPEVEKDLIK